MKYAFALGLVGLASTAQAHAGHDLVISTGWTHWLTQPEHLMPVLLLGSGVAVAWVVVRRRSRAR